MKRVIAAALICIILYITVLFAPYPWNFWATVALGGGFIFTCLYHHKKKPVEDIDEEEAVQQQTNE